MKKLAVFFPGIGYTVDKPLLHYSRKLVTDAGYEVKLLPYSGFPQKVKGDRDKMLESYRIALAQSEEMLSDIDFSDYNSVLFVGKERLWQQRLLQRISHPYKVILSCIHR